jgi:nicotinamide-nucleotide amidase
VPSRQIAQAPSAFARRLAQRLLARRAWLAVAESCTGGLIAKCLTDIPGSSGWFERGLVTYSNRAKQELLGVGPEIIQQHGAVSRQTAEAMARGLLVMTPADWGIAVTGIAGPDGGTPDKPVGLVWIAWAGHEAGIEAREFHFRGNRMGIRRAAARAALQGLVERLAR